MLTGWQRKGGHWYLLGADGAMLTGWQRVDGKWYFLDDSGAMATGWEDGLGDKRDFMDENGSMTQGWQRDGGKLGNRACNPDGSMSADEVKTIGGTFYGFDSSGAMLAHSIGLAEAVQANGTYAHVDTQRPLLGIAPGRGLFSCARG